MAGNNINDNPDTSAYKLDTSKSDVTIWTETDNEVIEDLTDSSESGESSSPDSDFESFESLQSQLVLLNQRKKKALEQSMNQLYKLGLNNVWIGSGWGGHDEQIHNNFSKLDRFHTRFVMDNYLRTGYLFMTRPQLNLQFSNLQLNRKMRLLSTMNPNTIQFAIRSYLDTRFARMHADKVAQCPFIDYRNPFFTLITNNVTDFSGGPSYQMSVETEEAGYYGESQAVAIGSDSYTKPFDIQLSVVDPIGGPIDAIMQFWTLYMELVRTGEMIIYPDQQAERVLNYTVSFYRFIMDPSMMYVRKMAKYTGCFPVSFPGASVFDFSVKDTFVDSLRKYNITFRCGSGHVDVDDPIIAEEFNMLVERYFPRIRCLRPGLIQHGKDSLDRQLVHEKNKPCLEVVDATLNKNGLYRNPLIPEYNYTGIPYLIDTDDGLRLDIISEPGELPFNRSRVGNTVFPSITFKKDSLNYSGMDGVEGDDLTSLTDKNGKQSGLIVVDKVPLLTAAAEQIEATMSSYNAAEDALIESYLSSRYNKAHMPSV